MARKLLVVSVPDSDAADAFARRASEQGWDVTAVRTDERTPNLPADYSGGIVLFDNGDSISLEWTARLRECTRYLNIPLIVVADSARKTHTRLLAVGASLVCHDGEHERVFSEIEARCNVQPVVTELRDNLLRPFIQTAVVTFQDMAGAEIILQSIYQKQDYRMFGDISAVIGLTGRSEGSMVISFPEKTAEALVRRILQGLADEPSPDLVRDCLGEVANVIAGQARGMMANTQYKFAITTPTVVSGPGHEIRHKSVVPCLVAAFASDLGDFALQLCLTMAH